MYWPPERICVIDFAIDDFSATQSTIIPTYKSRASGQKLYKAKPRAFSSITEPFDFGVKQVWESGQMDLATPVKVGEIREGSEVRGDGTPGATRVMGRSRSSPIADLHESTGLAYYICRFPHPKILRVQTLPPPHRSRKRDVFHTKYTEAIQVRKIWRCQLF